MRLYKLLAEHVILAAPLDLEAPVALEMMVEWRQADWLSQMTPTAPRPTLATRPQVGDGAREAFDEAFKTLLRTWHHYEVLRALGAPQDTVSAAQGALERARGEVVRRRLMPMS